MRIWRIAATSVTALGLLIAVLLFLARWVGVRFGGFDAFYTSTIPEIVGVSVLLLAGAVLYLAGGVFAIGAAVGLRKPERSTSNADVAAGVSKIAPLISEAVPQVDVDLIASAEHRVDAYDETVKLRIEKIREELEMIRREQEVRRSQRKGDRKGVANSGSLIRISRLSKVYVLGPVQVHALQDVSLDISGGSLTVILGPSGSGKTTLLNLLGGIDQASSGSIQFEGIDVARLDEAHVVDYRRERVGFVFQFFNLIPSLTARENVALAAELVPHASDVEKVLRMVGLAERMDHFPAELSGGEQQRVAIARALVKNPPLLLCDEPTGELDYTTGVKILEILKDVAHGDGRAVIVVTHNAVIAEMADQVVRLRGGRIDQIVRNPEPVPPAMLRW